MENVGIDSAEEQFSVDTDAETQRISIESQSSITAAAAVTTTTASDTSELSGVKSRRRRIKKGENVQEANSPGANVKSVGKGKKPKKEHDGNQVKKSRKPGNRKSKGQVSSDEYLVENIVDKKMGEDGKWRYLVKWIGWPSDTNTWEPIENLTKCENIVRDFEIEFNKRASVARKLQNVDTKENLALLMWEDCPEYELMTPNEVKGIIQVNDKLHYLVEWVKPNGETVRTLIKSTNFQVKYPRLVIKFYEKHITFIRDAAPVKAAGV